MHKTSIARERIQAPREKRKEKKLKDICENRQLIKDTFYQMPDRRWEKDRKQK
jgi:hypothetical protein